MRYKKALHIKTISDLQLNQTSTTSLRNKINCIKFDKREAISQLSEPIFLSAFTSILVLSGTGKICINYKTQEIHVNTMVLLSVAHLFNISECSDDFECLCLFVSKEFMDEMDTTDMIYKRIKYGVRLFNAPIIELTPEVATLLASRTATINEAIENTEHLYYKEVVLNTIFAFYLDLSNTIDRASNFDNDGLLTRYESIIKSFIELLISSYRTEHKIEFYASKLNISAHYLTLIIKRITGQSASDFIFEMLYSEARTLLLHSKLSIQEIAMKLNFSDQSSFGKFFRRKSGVSPIEFRKGK